jgi:hypothetical protein
MVIPRSVGMGIVHTLHKYHCIPSRDSDNYLACLIQEVTEEVMLRVTRTLHRETGVDALCLAGGVAFKDLRQFGLLVGGVFTVIGLWPLVFRSESPRLWAKILGGLPIGLGGKGRSCYEKTPLHTFIDKVSLAKEDMLAA